MHSIHFKIKSNWFFFAKIQLQVFVLTFPNYLLRLRCFQLATKSIANCHVRSRYQMNIVELVLDHDKNSNRRHFVGMR